MDADTARTSEEASEQHTSNGPSITKTAETAGDNNESPRDRPASKQQCRITRSITHPRDQESEHPLWTLWHKPSD